MSDKSIDKVDKLLEKYEETKGKVESFENILQGLDKTTDRKKTLWKEIYENALYDRESAAVLFTEAFRHMTGNVTEHATLGSTLSKYLERMCKSNEQILKLADLIARAEEKEEKISPDDMFAKISGDGE